MLLMRGRREGSGRWSVRSAVWGRDKGARRGGDRWTWCVGCSRQCRPQCRECVSLRHHLVVELLSCAGCSDGAVEEATNVSKLRWLSSFRKAEPVPVSLAMLSSFLPKRATTKKASRFSCTLPPIPKLSETKNELGTTSRRVTQRKALGSS